jgi:hypothetical protein
MVNLDASGSEHIGRATERGAATQCQKPDDPRSYTTYGTPPKVTIVKIRRAINLGRLSSSTRQSVSYSMHEGGLLSAQSRKGPARHDYLPYLSVHEAPGLYLPTRAAGLHLSQLPMLSDTDANAGATSLFPPVYVCE